MGNYFFLVLFTIAAYSIFRYFAYLTKDKESHEDGGSLSKFAFGRLLFFLGMPILGIFIYDIFKIHLAASPSSGVVGLITVLVTLLGLIFGEMFYQKWRKSSRDR
ncbi:hypothetical protein [Streptococcus ovuberis]|uniref:Uncharacterized protein n=1 Tax=Streptococcus ovuberis TaxID=1936207 RepID=A0A7X6MY73_9STRE|nr:hypothetical protein [Streptococcus ovuberis]NKZ20535.1 hypothetical protein [Streptococcus ovuberis]